MLSESIRRELLEDRSEEGRELVLIDATDLHMQVMAEDPDLARLSELTLTSQSCTSLTPLRTLVDLERLTLSQLKEPEDYGALGGLPKLRKLRLVACSGMPDLTALSEASGLEELSFAGCKDLVSLRGIGKLQQLKSITIDFCPNLKDIDELRQVAGLGTFVISGAPSVNTLRPLMGLKNLELVNLCSPSTGISKLQILEFRLRHPSCRVIP